MAGNRGKHASSHAWWHWWALAAGVVLVAGGGTAAGLAIAHQSGSSGHVQAQDPAASPTPTTALAIEQGELINGIAIAPAPGATGVQPNASVTVKGSFGVLSEVKVTSSSGATVAGTLQSTNNEWVSSGTLLPSTTYTVTATAVGPGFVNAQRTSKFTTLAPAEVVSATVFPTSDMTVGVGQPIVLTFDHDITTAAAQQAAESHFTVAMSQPVPGGWYWFSPHELHFRPQSYWPAHEQIQITGSLDGWNIGDGVWGTGQVSSAFSIGDSRISYANLQTEVMRVTLNGATIATYPISGGRPEYPTMDGDHIVLDRESVVHMVSSTVGIPVNSPNGYDEYVYDDVHISDSGEYVHSAPWSVGSQGVTNVSHGCINISPTNALSFFNFSRVGDVVEVTGSPRPAVTGDHGVMDWSTPWSQWAPGTVVHLSQPT